jgi:hypothetical protein
MSTIRLLEPTIGKESRFDAALTLADARCVSAT